MNGIEKKGDKNMKTKTEYINFFRERYNTKAETPAGILRAGIKFLSAQEPKKTHLVSYQPKAPWLRKKEEIRAEKISQNLGLPCRVYAEFLADKLTGQTKIQEIVEKQWSYRKASSSWAGGNNRFCVEIGKPFASGSSYREWSSNGKWSGNSASFRVGISRKAIHYFPEIWVGGLLVLDAEKIGTREFKLTWVEQGRGFELKTVNGFLIRGHHVETKSVDSARRIAAKRRSEAAKKLLMNRFKFDDKVLSKIWVGRSDSLTGGNCPAGTDAFISKTGQNIGGMRADALLELQDSVFTRRAIISAYARKSTTV